MRKIRTLKAMAIGFLIMILIALIAAPVVMAQDLGWRYDPSFGYVLDRTADGTFDVQVDERNVSGTGAVVLEGLRNGVPVKFNTTVSGWITDICIGTVEVNGVTVISKSNCDGVSHSVAAGEIIIRNSTGPNGGFRWTDGDPGSNACADGTESCWEISADGKQVYWIGPVVDGWFDVHQAAAPKALAAIRNGALVEFDATVPGEIQACHAEVYVNGMLVEKRHDCAPLEKGQHIQVSAGKIRIENSTTESGGWRWSPQPGIGWRSGVTRTPVPALTNTPTPTSTSMPSLPTSTPTVVGPDYAATQRALEATQTQMAAPPVVTDTDGDGIPDAQDLCANTPVGTSVDATGCPITATPPREVPWLGIIIGLVILLIVGLLIYRWKTGRWPWQPATTPPPPPPPPPPAAALAITTVSPLPAGTAGTPYSVTFTATGGVAPYSWSPIGMPVGMTINAATGVVNWPTPVVGVHTFAVQVTDSTTPANTVTKALRVEIV